MNYYHLRTPELSDGPRQGKRKSFSIVREWRDEVNARRFNTVEDPRVDVVNSRYHALEVSYREAEEQLTTILLEYRSKEQKQTALTFHSQDNSKLYETVWAEDYKFRYIASASNRMMEFARLLEVIGHESFIAMHPQHLQQLIDTHCGHNHNKQRRMATVANQLLKFIYNRGMAAPAGFVKMKKKRRREIGHLTLGELSEVLKQVKYPVLRDLYLAAFCSGARLGELMNVSPSSIKDGPNGTGTLLVKGQIVRGEAKHKGDSAPRGVRSVVIERDLLKNQTELRQSLVLEFGLAALKSWATVPRSTRLEFRKRLYLSELQRAVAATFPGRKLKFHDLRHSYAIHLLAIGMTLEDVSRSIGDTMEVCEEFYAGFSHTPLSVQTMAERYIARQPRLEESSNVQVN
jgi:integrase